MNHGVASSGDEDGDTPGATAGLWSEELIWISMLRFSRCSASHAEPLRWLLARRLSGSWMIRFGSG